jgi:hypothetical protein
MSIPKEKGQTRKKGMMDERKVFFVIERMDELLVLGHSGTP